MQLNRNTEKRMKVLFTTNFPSPYRTDFFNELGKYCDLTVAFERRKALHRDEKWTGNPAVNFKEVYLDLKPVGTSQSKGLGIVKYLAENKFDVTVFCGYASPSVIAAMEYCRFRKIPYYIEFDGGFFRKGSFLKNLIKRHVTKNAKGNFITCKETEKFLKELGVPEQNLFRYPFSSVYEKDIIEKPLTAEEKKAMKSKLGIKEEKAVVSVGRFIYVKAFDELLKASKNLGGEVGVYIIGGEPTEEYISICKENNLKNVHFYPFCEKEKVYEWYKAADFFAFTTRGDVWGLVINEAMACGLPIISSDMCIAARELVDESNGAIYRSGNIDQLGEYMKDFAAKDLSVYSENSLKKIRRYTIEEMAKKHMEILQKEDL